MQKLTQNRPKPKMQNMVIHGSIEELLNSLHYTYKTQIN